MHRTPDRVEPSSAERSRKIWLLIPLLVLQLALASCSGADPWSEIAEGRSIQDFTPVPIPPADYVTVTWVGDWLVMEAGGQHTFDHTLWRARVDGRDLERLDLPIHPACGPSGLNSFKEPQRLPNGKLGYLVHCRTDDDSVLTSFLFMMTYEMETGEVEQLLPYTLPNGTDNPRFNYSWNPEMTEAIVWKDGGLNSSSYRLTLDRWIPLDPGFPQIRAMEWSPDGTRIAFVAAPEQGLVGFNRLYATYHLYLMDPDGRNMQRVVEGIRYPVGLRWTPDGEQLLFSAHRTSDTVQQRFWLFDLASGSVSELPRLPSVPVWSPDGEQLVFVVSTGDRMVEEDEFITHRPQELFVAPADSLLRR